MGARSWHLLQGEPGAGLADLSSSSAPALQPIPAAVLTHPALVAARSRARRMRSTRRRARRPGVVVVPGTWGRLEDWYKPGSGWASYMAGLGCEIETFGGRPFEWSTGLDGIQFWRRLFGRVSARDHWSWQAGGAALFAWLVPPAAPAKRIAPRDVRIVCHSHGLQVVLYAAAAGLRIDRLLSVTGPVREDMAAIAAAARPNIREWRHVHSDGSDRFQWLGAIGDGVLGITRAHPLADVNQALPAAGHSGVFRDPSWFDRVGPGWAAFLR
jgi:hypothetical protein